MEMWRSLKSLSNTVGGSSTAGTRGLPGPGLPSRKTTNAEHLRPLFTPHAPGP